MRIAYSEILCGKTAKKTHDILLKRISDYVDCQAECHFVNLNGIL